MNRSDRAGTAERCGAATRPPGPLLVYRSRRHYYPTHPHSVVSPSVFVYMTSRVHIKNETDAPIFRVHFGTTYLFRATITHKQVYYQIIARIFDFTIVLHVSATTCSHIQRHTAFFYVIHVRVVL